MQICFVQIDVLVKKTKHLMNLFKYIKLSQLRTSLEMLYLILKYCLLVMPQIFDGSSRLFQKKD